MAVIDTLLNLVPDSPSTVLDHLQAHPELASKQDGHGYSLLHAATSYNHLDLFKALIVEYHVDPNILDEDGETCLFNAETIDFAKELLHLGVKLDIRNADGQTAAEKLDDDDEQPEVAAFLREYASANSNELVVGNSTSTSWTDGAPATNTTTNGDGNESQHHPPPLPEGVQINIGTMQPGEEGGEPDPEFRRRIEEIASRTDFDSASAQQELRDLITDAVSGLTSEGQGPASRRRIE